MAPRRISYEEWVADQRHDPDSIPAALCGFGPDDGGAVDPPELKQLRQVVRAAVESLGVWERFFVIRYYFQGLSYRSISEECGLTANKLAGLHRRALRKLNRALAPFVKVRFKIESDLDPACPICRSGHRKDIDNLLARRDRSRSWRPVISAIRSEYSLTIRSPQVLIGHEKYH